MSLSDTEIRTLVERYGTRGPRYTSYPTSPQWAAGGEDVYRDLLAARTTDEPVAVYVHIPFCRRLCLYCGCNMRITRRRDLVERYLAALRTEIDTVCELLAKRPKAAQMHFGGGTPTYLSPQELEDVIDHIDSRFPRSDSPERSIEVDPRVTNREHLDMLVERGFRRVSIGLQDLDPAVQAAVKREYSEADLREFVTACRDIGMSGVNLDLIYGLPKQNSETWARTLGVLLDIRPDRLAVYGYAHVPWAKPHQKSLERVGLPNAQQRLTMALEVRRAFVDAGYVAIGMDHFALPTDPLAEALERKAVHRNFMGYSTETLDSMVAFGVSAIGDFPAAYVHNSGHLETYCELIEDSGLAVIRHHSKSVDDRIRRAVIINLMGSFAIKPDEIEKAFDIDFAGRFAQETLRLDGFVRDGLLERHGTGWRATEAGELVIRNIAMVFDSYLEDDAGEAQRYSATI